MLSECISKLPIIIINNMIMRTMNLNSTGMKLRYTIYLLMMALTTEIIMDTTIVGCIVGWCSRPRLQEKGAIHFIFDIITTTTTKGRF